MSRVMWLGTRGRAFAIVTSIVTLATMGACNDVNTDPKAVASIAFDSIAAPSIIAGDSLRDSLGVARPLRATAFNVQGNPIIGTMVTYRSADAGVRVDSVAGFVVADTARTTPIRLVAQAGGLQTAPDTIYIVPTPDTVFALKSTDSVLYSVRDTTPTISNPLTVSVAHRAAGGSLTPVRGYFVSYQITYPTDTLLAQLVGRDGIRASRVDTTAADGTTGERVRVRQTRLTAAKDSVVIMATVRLRGALVPGAPVRIVLTISPHP